jgi:proteasome component ECM29
MPIRPLCCFSVADIRYSAVLPVAALVDQFKTYPDCRLLRHYDQIFIRLSLGRLPKAERTQLVPKVLQGIGSDNGPNVEALFNIFLRLLPDVKIPFRGSKDDELFREIMFSDPQDAAFVAKWLGKVFLLAGTLEQSQKRGLKESDFTFLTLDKPDTWSTENNGLSLDQTSRLAVLFLQSGAFTDDERFLPTLYASAHGDSAVSTVAKDMLKRTTISHEDPTCVKQLFEAHSILSWQHKIRALRLLARSTLATTFTDEIRKLFDLHYKLLTDPTTPNRSRSGEYRGYPSWAIENFKALFHFLNWTARVTPKTLEFAGHAQYMMSRSGSFITDTQGWPTPMADRRTADDRTLRCLAYQVVGSLAASAARGAMSDQDYAILILWLLQSLAQDPVEEAVVHIDSALSSIASFFKPATDPVLMRENQSLISCLTAFLNMGPSHGELRSNRHAIVLIANQCYPFTKTCARWIDILAISRPGERKDVVEEGERGLDPRTFFPEDKTMVGASVGPDQAVTLPDWNVMRGHFAVIPAMDSPSNAMMVHAKLFEFVKQLLFLTALRDTDFRFVSGWQHQLDVLVKTDKDTRDKIRQYLRTGQETMLHWVFERVLGVLGSEDPDTMQQTAQNFLEVASLAPTSALILPTKSWRQTEAMCTNGRRQLQVLGARIQGVRFRDIDLTSDEGDRIASQFVAAVDTLEQTTDADPAELLTAEGCFLSLAYSMSRLVYRGQEIPGAVREVLSRRTPSLLKVGSSSLDLVLEGLIQLWTADIPPSGQVVSLGNPADRREYLIEQYIEPLSVQAKKGNEKAITALGRFAMVIDDDDVLETVLNRLYDLHEMKQPDVHFAIGEAIVASVACWDSETLQLAVDVDPFLFNHRRRHRAEKLRQVLEKLISDSKQTKPSLIKASGIWLFCMIQYCSHLSEVQTRLRSCQVAFMRLLGARDELVQETAARGLAVAYEKGDESLKEALVRDFIAAFTGSTVQIKVDEETELFELGALPTGEGNSVTSYKDIVNLANEVGDQTLVYKFMSLANSAHTWAFRSAFGRFGLTNILSVSDVDPKLYPKLFRYRFDPNTNVQKSMDDIWKALVKDSNEVLDTYFDDILKDLLVSILGREWRVRQASCAALSELIQGRPFEKYEKYYQQIWANALKVLDDVKATVRSAAQNLCDVLSNTLVRQVELSGSSETTKKMMHEGLPFLLSDKGVDSTTDDVKLIATSTILKLSKSGGKALRPFIPDMVTKLLGSLSTLEPEQVNYLYNRTNQDNREKLDKLRAQMVARSPLFEAIENLLRNLDADVMKQLVPQLELVIKTAVGMPSKMGCSQVLITLATSHGLDFEPYSARFLQLMEEQILDRNDEVSLGYAKAVACIIRVAPDEARERFVSKLIQLYLESESDTRREDVADAVATLSKVSPDYFDMLEEYLLPFSFVGMHDTDPYVRREFEDVWKNNAGGTLSITRYTSEIVNLIQHLLDKAQWALKHGGALACASLVLALTKRATVSGYVNDSELNAVWPVFERSLALKTFAGKEKLLPAFSSLVSKGKLWWENDAKIAQKLKKIAVREAKRNNENYRTHAFKCLWEFAAALEDIDMLDEISGIVQPFIAGFLEDVEMKHSSDTAGQTAAARGEDKRSMTVWAAIEAIAKGYNRANLRRHPMVELSQIITAFEGQGTTPAVAQESPILARPPLEHVRRAYWYDCVTELLVQASDAAREGGSTSGDGVATLLWLAKTLDLDNNQLGTEAQRLARAKAAVALCGLWRDVSIGDKWHFRAAVWDVIRRAVEEERSMEVKKKWQSCLATLEESEGGAPHND